MRRTFGTSLVRSLSRGPILDHQEFVPTPQLIDAPPLKPLEKAVPTDLLRSKPSPVVPPTERVVTEGKFFRVGSQKFHPRGVTYGPFKPDQAGGTFPKPEQVERDFMLMKELNANCLRVYHVPPRWFLDLAQQHGLKVLVDYYWPKHTCFLEDRETIQFARDATRQAAEALKGHPAVFALTLANEIPPDIARWYGAKRIAHFIDGLAAIVKEVDPQRLVTFVNFPTTEFLQPTSLDFVSFNVYLHEPRPFANYLDACRILRETNR